MPKEQFPTRKMGFKEAWRRKPIEFYEAMHTEAFTIMGGVAGAGLGYLNVLDKALDNQDLTAPLIEGAGATLTGAVFMGGASVAIEALNRGWLGELREGEEVQISDQLMRPEDWSYFKRFTAGIMVSATSLGIPVGAMLAGLVVAASGHNETSQIITSAGIASVGAGVAISGLSSFHFFREKPNNNQNPQ